MKSILVLMCLVAVAWARPQGAEEEKPMPYEYKYKVEDEPTQVYFGKEETGNEEGRVEGEYYVWFPDGKLMTVKYYVDGESGFVPTITFTDTANPFSGRR